MTNSTKRNIKIIIIAICVIFDILLMINIKDVITEFTKHFNVEETVEGAVIEETTESNGDETVGNEVTTDVTESEYSEYELQLIEKYNAVFEWQRYSGDFSYEQLFYLDNLCTNYDIPLELMLSIICTESGFRSYAKASSSTASGYCQILKMTAKDIYEKMLKYGTYDTENHRDIQCTNWQLNLEMGCRYIYWCNTYYGGDTWEAAVMKYHGSTNHESNEIYLNTVNQKMSELFGIEVADLT